jgi:predicted Rossmann-fold nucleotide-binding protein
LLEQGNISETDLKLFRIVDTADEAIEHLNKFYGKYSLKPNF